MKGHRKNPRRRAKSVDRKEQPQAPVREELSRKPRKRIGSKALNALREQGERLSKQLGERLEQRADFVSLIKNAPTSVIKRTDGSLIKVGGLTDPVMDRADWDNEREITRLQYEIRKIDELLHPPTGRPRGSEYERAFREKQGNPTLTNRDLARKYFPICFTDKKDSEKSEAEKTREECAVEMMRQGLRRLHKSKP